METQNKKFKPERGGVAYDSKVNPQLNKIDDPVGYKKGINPAPDAPDNTRRGIANQPRPRPLLHCPPEQVVTSFNQGPGQNNRLPSQGSVVRVPRLSPHDSRGEISLTRRIRVQMAARELIKEVTGVNHER